MPLPIESLILTVGYVGLFAIVFSETGLFVGFFLPGDTLLTTAGILAQRGQLDLAILIPLLIVAAISGDAVGYNIGRRAGPALFKRENARLFRRRYLENARDFFRRHGGKAIVLARFIGIVRTFVPPAAGAAGMPSVSFTLFNVLGGALWVVSMLSVGYFVGNALPNLDLVLIGVIFLISVIPLAVHLWRDRRLMRRLRAR